jgi:hypothetical protein
MISMEYLTDLGKGFAARGSVTSVAVFNKNHRRAGLIHLGEMAAETDQQGMYTLGQQAAREERQTGVVQQIAIIAEGWIGTPNADIRPSLDQAEKRFY